LTRSAPSARSPATAAEAEVHRARRRRGRDVLGQRTRGRLVEHPVAPALDADPDGFPGGDVLDGLHEQGDRDLHHHLTTTLAQDETDVRPIRTWQLGELRLQ